MFKHKLTTLENGLRLITVPMPQVESLSVMVGVGAGSRYETKRVNGLFHFIEHMAFKGTKKRPSTMKIASEIEGVGGEFNAFTSKEFSGYYIKLAAKHIYLAFDILSDMLINSLYKSEEIEREKGVVVEEINLREDTPVRRLMEIFLRLLYGDNSMGRSVSGEKETVQNIRRGDFLAYIKRLYFPENIVISVAGKVKNKMAEKLAKEFFILPGKVRQTATKPIMLTQKSPRLRLVYKKTEQAHLCLGVPGYNLFHKDRFALGCLATILGGGLSSRLHLSIIDRRGLGYFLDCDPGFFTDSGFLVVRSGVHLKKIQEVIKLILDEFLSLSHKKVSLKELNKAREFNKGSLILALEDSMNVAERYAVQLILEKGVRTPQQALDLYDKVKVEDIQRVAKDIFRPEKLNLAIIGPYKNSAAFKRLL